MTTTATQDTGVQHQLTALVRPDEGLIARRIFTDPDVYRLELQHIFSRSWLMVGHSSQLKRPGDFLTTTMGEDPVIVARQKDGGVKVFLNSCRHRGMKVCRSDFGNMRAFACPYHGWVYGTDGSLVSVPLRDRYPASFREADRGLIEVPHVVDHKGLLFANWDPDARPFAEAMGQALPFLDAFVDRLPGGSEVIGGVHKWIIRGNWKFAAEQFGSDAFHAPTSHGSAIQALLHALPDDLRRQVMQAPLPDGRSLATPEGHGICFGTGDTAADPSGAMLRGPAVHAYYLEQADAFKAHLGDELASAIGQNTTIFPNFSYLAGASSTMRVWHPRGPNAMEVHAWVLVDSAAPKSVKEAQRLTALQTFGPSGFIEQDDGENWSEIQKVIAAPTNRGDIYFDYSLGLDLETVSSSTDAERTGGFLSETPARGFYRRYLQLMLEQRS